MANATFNYTNADYARSKTGIKTVIDNLKSDIDKAVDLAKDGKNSEYSNVVNTVKKNWSGSDAKKFLSQFEKDVNTAVNQLKRAKKDVESYLNTNYDNFIKFQNQNASKM